MPSTPLRPCPGQGGRCPNRVPKGRCPACTKAKDQQRGSRHARGYDAQWVKARKAFLMANPLCLACMRQGRYVAATVVDHIIPHRGDPVLFWDEAHNWQPMCASHHSEKTAREDGGFGNAATR